MDYEAHGVALAKITAKVGTSLDLNAGQLRWSPGVEPSLRKSDLSFWKHGVEPFICLKLDRA
jgi:hypothetical protein